MPFRDVSVRDVGVFGEASSNVTGDAYLYVGQNTEPIQATVSGLAGSGLVLELNSGSDLSITANGTFPFASQTGLNSTMDRSRFGLDHRSNSISEGTMKQDR
jgi:hypothetical protein